MRWVLITAVVAAGALILGAGALAQTGPEFKLGFKVLADVIPGEVGDPLEDEHYGPEGDSLQQTTKGLMVWRNADNWTAFTNGSRTWVNGPEGVQERGVAERFPWEASAPTPAPVAAATPIPVVLVPPTPIPAPTRVPTPTPRSPANLKALKVNVVDGEDLFFGTTWVMGELRNQGDIAAYNVTVSARLLSATGEVAGTGSQTFPYLGPGDTIGYRMDVKRPTTYVRAEVSASSVDASYARYGKFYVATNPMQKTSQTYAGDSFEFSGTLRNDGGVPLQVGTLYAWFLDEQDNVAWADMVMSGSALMAPGDKADFLMRTTRWKYNPKIASINQVRWYAVGMVQ